LVSLACPIATPPTVALDLATDGGWRSIQESRYRTVRVTGRQSTRYFFAFSQAQRHARSVSWCRAYPAALSQYAVYGRVVSVKQLGDLLK
jgi:hypothetical protein